MLYENCEKQRAFPNAFPCIIFLAISKISDGNFEMNFQLKNGVPYYHLNYKGKTVIEDSKLGLRLLKDNTIAFDNVNKLPDGKNLEF